MSKANVSPGITAAASFVIPGLGQILSGQFRRGATVLVAFGTSLALFLWRLNVVAHREVDWIGRLSKTTDLKTGFVIIAIIGFILVWILNILDAAKLARQPSGKTLTGPKGVPWLFAVILALFFTIGWQISEIDIRKLTQEASEAWVPLSKVLWPWEAAIERITDTNEAITTIMSRCKDNSIQLILISL